jgi:hypothetical protein
MPDGSIPEGSSDGGPSCGDLTTSANCGRCGHDCGKGACNAGLCAPYVVGTSASAAWYLAVDEQYIYWTGWTYAGGDGAIRRMSKLDGAEQQIVINAPESFDLLVDGNQLLFTSVGPNAGVWRGPKNGGVAPVAIFSGPTVEIAATPAKDGWCFTEVPNGQPSHVHFLPRTLGSIDNRAELPAANGIEGIATDGTYVYWSNQGGPGGGSIGRAALKGTAAAEPYWTPDQEKARKVAVDGDAVYWTRNVANGGVTRRGKNDNTTRQMLARDVLVGGFVVTDTELWVAVEGEGRVVHLPKAGGDTIELRETFSAPGAMAQDANAVYFVEKGTRRIWRVVK